MEPPEKKMKLTDERRRSERLRNRQQNVRNVNLGERTPGRSFQQLHQKPSQKNIMNFIIENKLIPKWIKTSNVKKTQNFLEKLLNTTFSSEIELETDLLIEVRDLLKAKCGLSDLVFSPAMPIQNTVLQQQHLMTAAAAASDDTAAAASDDTAAAASDDTAAASDDTAAATSVSYRNEYIQVSSENLEIYVNYETALVTFVSGIYEKNCKGIFNFMINCKNLTETVKTELIKNYSDWKWNSQIIDESLPNNILFYDLEDHEISEAEYEILHKLRKSGKNIVILNALPIQGQNFQIIKHVFLTHSMISRIILDKKTNFILYGTNNSDTQYHFDLLYDIDLVIPETEIEIQFIMALLTQNTYQFDTLTNVLKKKDEMNPLNNYILKLYSHNLISWCSTGKIIFASNSIKNKYASYFNDDSTKPVQCNEFLNCVIAANKLSKMKEADIETLSFEFLTKLSVHLEHLIRTKLLQMKEH